MPGFVQGHFHAAKGILIPVRNLHGEIVALKVRVDGAANNKYRYVTSYSEQYNPDGAKADCSVHVPIGTTPACEILRVTEGELKPDIASALSNIPTIGIPGVGSWKKAVPVIAALRPKLVRLAFDADAATNIAVASAQRELGRELIGKGFVVELETWDMAIGKGIDDVFAAGETPDVITGAAVGIQLQQIWEAAKRFGQSAEPSSSTPRPDEPPSDSYQIEPPPTLRQLVRNYQSMRDPIIHGLLRRGETMNIIAPPKTGKSWLVSQLAINAVTGHEWHGFQLERGNVLILDNELHEETTASRIPKVADAMGIDFDAIADTLSIQNLRGKSWDIFRLRQFFEHFKPRDFNLIVLDAFYRFMPKGSDENDNGTMTDIYNALDSYAAMLDCAFVCIHYTSKGNQSNKAVTDVGAGAGAQSRAVDTHLVLRSHAESGVIVMDAAVRSWAPINPICLRWDWPLWHREDKLDPAQLKAERPGRIGSGTSGGQKPSRFEQVKVEVLKLLQAGPATKNTLKTKISTSGQVMKDVIEAILEEGLIQECKVQNQRGEYGGYCLV